MTTAFEKIAELPSDQLARLNRAQFEGTAEYFRGRADEAFRLHNAVAPMIRGDEGITEYRQRLLNTLTLLSDGSPYSAVDFRNISAPAALRQFEQRVVDDAIADFRKPVGPLREVRERSADHAGREIVRFYGDPENCWGPFKQVPQRVIGWNHAASRGANTPVARANRPIGSVFRDGSVRLFR